MSGTVVRMEAPVRRRGYMTLGFLAGLAGGLAEVAWIALYQTVTGHDAAIVARGVTESVLPAFAMSPAALPLGVAIHMALSVVLGLAIAIMVPRALPRLAGTVLEPVAVVTALVAVWAVNFFVVLPVVNPDFVTVVPYAASLISKTLFGVAAAFVFWCATPQTATG